MAIIRVKVLGLILILFFAFRSNVFASEILFVEKGNENVDADTNFDNKIKLSIQVTDGTIYYLRGVFYKKGSTNYCGFTFNGNEWFSGPYSSNEGWKNFLRIEVINNEWVGTISSRIDPSDSGCSDSGEYEFKVQRFTEGSGNSSFDNQEAQSLFANIPSPTPTPSPTKKPSPTQTPTKNPTPTKFLEKKQTNLITATGTDEKTNDIKITPHVIEEDRTQQEVLSASDSQKTTVQNVRKNISGNNENNNSEVQNNKNNTEEKSPALWIITIGIIILIVCCGILLKNSLMNSSDRELTDH